MLGALLDAGGRLAGPGEFTRRAFLAGRIDLAQAEAVLAAVNSRTEAGLEAALAQIKGAFSGKLSGLERDLLDLLAGIEAGIEFPDELENPAEPRGRWQAELRRLAERAGRLRRASAEGRIMAEGIRVVIAGRPNVGKSSLLNALLEQERAIVTDVPGTTRDEISELITLAGLPVRLTDTAGIRPPRDRIEKAGVRRSRARVKSADLLLLVLDRSRPLEAADRRLVAGTKVGKTLLVLNKIDRPDRLGALPGRAAGLERVEVSARTGAGLEVLKERVAGLIREGRVSPDSETPVFLGVYQERALRHACEALSEAAAALTDGIPLDFVLASVRRAARHLSEISGRRVDKEVLDQIFSRFCIGK
ncbi:MAG: tRNA modification GTPase MnmE [candidate division TA06 bacterium ADurb.Bin417]|uniref:tRNA modification GTPase MnmE n=1 Tax=candidate division TA06 bacterium ADurb.Bin417 TaxID=1852828 RepID=A0A1V5M9T6_UNCT6|nr:MAG: tRNA modification GTPase MnmE [candidate division TA06 bacterium ADurb.Bin417]